MECSCRAHHRSNYYISLKFFSNIISLGEILPDHLTQSPSSTPRVLATGFPLRVPAVLPQTALQISAYFQSLT